MSRPPRIPIADLVVNDSPSRSSLGAAEVWSLNLDQIQSGSGRVLRKVMVQPDLLGPSTYPFDAGTVLYSKLRPYLNKVVVADDAGFATTELVPLQCNLEKVLPRYLAYFLRSPEFLSFANTVVAGAKMPRMVMSEFWRYKAPLPPLSEQRRIAAILDKAFAIRAKRREALTQLDHLAQSIFVEMFGDQRPASLGVDSCAFSELVEVNPKISAAERQSLSETDVAFLPMSSVSDSERRVVSPELRPFREVSKGYTPVKRGDVVVAKITPCYENGKMALLDDLSTEYGFGSTEFHVFRAASRHLALFVYFFLRLDWIAGAGAKAMKGAAGQKRVPADFFESLRVERPDLDQLQKFACRIEKIEHLKTKFRLSALQSNSQFESLQYRAFQGQL